MHGTEVAHGVDGPGRCWIRAAQLQDLKTPRLGDALYVRAAGTVPRRC